jgi:hypothetical protein
MDECTRPKTTTSKRRAILKIVLAFGQIPLDCNLRQRTDFHNLRPVLDDALLEYPLLRSFYVDFLRLDRVDLQLRFRVNLSALEKSLGNEHPGPDTILLDADAAKAEGWRYLAILSRRLYELHSYVRACIVLGNYKEAGWTIDFDDINHVDQSRALEVKHALMEVGSSYLGQRTDLERSKSIIATFRKHSLPELTFSIIRRLQ